MTHSFHKAGKIIFLITCVMFFSLVVWKAFTMGLTYDEAYSYLHHARLSLRDIFQYAGTLPANNHILNTLSMKFFSSWLGVSELTLRIGSIVGTLLYLGGLYRLTAYLGQKRPIVRYVAPVIFLANPFVYDFLVAARGYSLALGSMMLALSYFLPLVGGKYSIRKLHLMMVFLVMMTVSNLSFLQVYIGVVGVYVIHTLYSSRFRLQFLWKRYGIMMLYSIVLAVRAIVPIRSMQLKDDLRFGGLEGIFSDTYLSLIQSYLYENTNTTIQIIIIIAFSLILLRAVRYTWQYYGVKKEQYIFVAHTTLLFILVSLSIVAQHVIMETPYVIERTAIYYFPIFGLIGLTLIHKATTRLYIYYILGAGWMLLHFITSVNVNHIPLWRADIYTESVLRDLSTNNFTHNRSITLGIDWVNEPVVEFYLLKNNISSIRPFIISNTSQKPDIYYVSEETYKNYLMHPEISYRKNYPDARMILFTLN